MCSKISRTVLCRPVGLIKDDLDMDTPLFSIYKSFCNILACKGIRLD